MKSADLFISDCSQVVTCRGPAPKRRDSLADIGLIEDSSLAVSKGRIMFVGSSSEMKSQYRLKDGGTEIDGRGMIALPGFVDPHTHLPFAGSREEEFRLRLAGATYQQLAEKGMGIQTTVKATRSISRDRLASLCLKRLDSMLRHGTTTVEAKSGYGLNREDEIKQLKVLHEVDSMHPIDIVKTYMGAHDIPPEYSSDKEAYIERLITEFIPEVGEKKLAEFCDFFCEEGVFSVDDTRRMIRAAQKAGLKIRIHADEFASLGGAILAVEEEAASADHLIAVTDEGISALSKSRTAAVLLPGVPFFLMQDKKAPARKLIDGGAVVALATDFNPGSSMTESMHFVLQLAVFTLQMSVEEAINAATINAAFALGREKNIGSLEINKKADIILCDVPNYLHLVYHVGINHVRYVIKNGTMVLLERNVI